MQLYYLSQKRVSGVDCIMSFTCWDFQGEYVSEDEFREKIGGFLSANGTNSQTLTVLKVLYVITDSL